MPLINAVYHIYLMGFAPAFSCAFSRVRLNQPFFFAGAACCETDKQGRILLPQVLREYADLQKDVVLAGVLGRVEIWSRDRWQDANTYDDMDEIAEHMAQLGLGI